MKISGWGRYPEVDAELYSPLTIDRLRSRLRELPAKGVTPRGLGRSYGDSSIGGSMLLVRWLNHFLSFEEESGLLHCEAGVSLSDILDVFVPKGWFLPVTPGTRFVTVGGAIASDVHGKNHHVAGCFSEHVVFLDIVLGDGRLLRCSPHEHPDLFRATCGGMGLTGMIVSAAIRLQPIASAWIEQTICKAANLQEALDLFGAHSDVSYSVAWIDCIAGGRQLGRSLLMMGEHANEGGLEMKNGKLAAVPFDMPSSLLNPYSIRVFNTLYYHRIREKHVHGRVHYEPFFYPLDSIGEWNRMYGNNGFTQYQFAVPKEAGTAAMEMILKAIVASGKGSFLAVLKAFGKGNDNPLSFPMEGYTLALDFKIEQNLFPLLERLDAMVLDCGGRLYLTKDARMSGDMLMRSYPELGQFKAIRETYGGKGAFSSHQSIRLGLD